MDASKNMVDVTTDDFASMMVCAVRYALGRQSYMPSTVIRFITPLIPVLSDKAIGCIERDVRDPMTYGCGSYGDEKIDKPGWLRFLAALEEERKKRGLRQW